MKIVTTTVSVLLTIILIGVAGLFLASLIPLPGAIEIKIVKSGSMEPAIPTGSLVVIKPDVTWFGFLPTGISHDRILLRALP